MLKALLWKEWREQRSIAFAGAGAGLMLPLIVVAVATATGNAAHFGDAAEMVPFLLGVVVWPLFAALVGATVHSESASPAVAGFMLSRPVSRTVVWSIKIAVGGVAIAFVVATSYFIALRLDLWSGGLGFRFPFESDPVPWPPSDAVRGMAVGALCITFCGAVFLSTVVRRSLGAAIGGVGLALSSQAVGLIVVDRISPYPVGPRVPLFFGVLASVLAAALLLGSVYVFRVVGTDRAGDRRRQVRRAWVGLALSLPLAVGAAGVVATHVSTESGRPTRVYSVPGAELSVWSLDGGSFTGASLWTVGADGTRRRLTGRLAEPMAMTPDGSWLIYASPLTRVGTYTPGYWVRAVRIDGSEDRRLAYIDRPRHGYRPTGFVSPDSRFLLVPTRGPGLSERLLIIEIEGEGRGHVDKPQGARFSPFFHSPLWVSPRSFLAGGIHPSSYWLVDITTGSIEPFYQPPEDVRAETLASSQSTILVLETEDDERRRLVDRLPPGLTTRLITIPSGASREIEPLCPASREAGRPRVALSDDERFVFFACGRLGNSIRWVDPADPDGLLLRTLHRRDLASGETTIIATLDGIVSWFTPSPDHSRFLVTLHPTQEVRRGAETTIAPRPSAAPWRVVVDSDGAVRTLTIPPGWSVQSWDGNDAIALRRDGRPYDERGTAYLDLAGDVVEFRRRPAAAGGW